MALTRVERKAIEILIGKVRKLESRLNTLEILNDGLQKMVNGINSESNILDWSSSQIDEWLKPYLLNYMKNTGIILHDHTNNQRGGDCFAKLGANLINGE